MKRQLLFYIVLVVMFGCSPRLSHRDHPNVIRIKGSDSMLLLVERCAAEYMRQHIGVSIYVEGGGSGAGTRALIDGSIDICAASRPMLPEEVQQLASQYQSLGISILCGKDALAVVVHPSNPVTNLSTEDIRKIFTGMVRMWNDVGGVNKPISLYSREPNSGTYLYFEEHVLLGAAYSDECTFAPGARALIDAIARDSAAIGYSTFVYANNVKLVSVNGVQPTAKNVRNGTYPISRYLYFYTTYSPEGAIKEFIDWVVSEEGQRIVKANGYVPLFDIE